MERKIKVKDQGFIRKLNKYRKLYKQNFFNDSEIDQLDPLFKSLWEPCKGMKIYITENIFLYPYGKYRGENER